MGRGAGRECMFMYSLRPRTFNEQGLQWVDGCDFSDSHTRHPALTIHNLARNASGTPRDFEWARSMGP